MNYVIKSMGQPKEVKFRKRIFEDLDVGDIFINFCDGELYLSAGNISGDKAYNAIKLSTGLKSYIMWNTEVAVYKGKVIFDGDMFDDEIEVEE